MQLDPINTGEMKFFLDFISDGTGRMSINEPVGFDGFRPIIETLEGRYARDVKGIDQTLKISSHSDKEAFDKLSYYNRYYKTTSEVNLIVTTYGVDYIIGSLEFYTISTDQITYHEFKIIRNNKEAILKKRAKSKVNVFSDKDLDLNDITPVSSSNILLKALPVAQTSTWQNTSYWAYTGASFTTNRMFQNPIKNLTKSGVENSFSYIFSSVAANNDVISDPNNFLAVRASNDLVNNKIEFKGVQIKFLVPSGDAFDLASSWYLGTVAIQFLIYVGDGVAPSTFTQGYDLQYTATYQSTYDVTGIYGDLTGLVDEYLVVIDDQEFDLPDIEKDHYYYNVFNLRRILTITDWTAGEITITGTSLGIDSVVKGVRLNDAQRQVIASASGNTVTAPLFEQNGEHYDNFVFNGEMCRGIDDVTLNISFDQIANQLGEINGDYQVVENNVFIGKYSDFYTNQEIASFTQTPYQDFGIHYNKEYLYNALNYSYKDYETDKDTENTRSAIQTESQWNIANKNLKESKDIEIEFIRDRYKIEFVRKRSTQTDPDKALSEDKKVFILDVIELPIGTTRGFSASIRHNINSDDNLQLLNDNTYNWSTLGASLNDTFTIVEGENVGNYTIVSFSFSLIELQPTGATTPNFNGQTLTKVSYPITSATYTNRTGEDFDLIEGIDNPDKASNLRYSIKRNLLRWGEYLNTVLLNTTVDSINNLEFINGGNVTTQYDGGAVLIENADLTKEGMTEAILSYESIKKTLSMSWQEFISIENGMKNTRGFIRTTDNLGRMLKIYPRNCEFIHEKNILEIEEAEVRLESEFIEITTQNDLIYINEPYYDRSIVGNIEFSDESGMIIIYDKRFVPLINETRYDFIKVNNVSYESSSALAQALKELLDD